MGLKETFKAKKESAQAWLEGRQSYRLVRDLVKEMGDDNVTRLSAAVAYYSIFSIAPLLLVAVALAGFFFGEAASEGRLVDSLAGVMGPQAASVLEQSIAAADERGGGVLATVIGLLVVLLGASRVFKEVQDALNTVWDVEPEEGGWKRKIVKRLTSFGMVLGIGFLLLAVLVANAVLAALGGVIGPLLPGGAIVWRAISLLVSVVLVAALLAVLYHYIPDAEVKWRDAGVGAVVTAILFAVGQFALSLYFSRSDVGSTYGAAGALVVVLVWIYYTALVFFIGAEFTQVYANKLGGGVRPEPAAHSRPGEDASDPSRPSEPGEGGRGGRGRGYGGPERA